MKVQDLLESVEGDIDIHDDMTDELGIAWCGTQLTVEGRREFADVLKYDCKIIVDDYCRVIVHTENEKQLRRARALFEGMAGYCGEKEFDRWFTDKEDMV